MPITPNSVYHRTVHRAAMILAAYVAILVALSFSAGCANNDRAAAASNGSAADGQQAKLNDRAGASGAPAVPAGIGPAAAAEGTGHAPSADRETAIDLQKMQGKWERIVRPEEQVAYKRVIKEIQGNQETVTYYGPHGEVQRVHTVDFRLERYGPVKVFTYYNMRITAGPDANKTPDPGKPSDAKQSYIYRLTDHEFDEVWGFLAGQETRPISYHVHQRLKAGTAADAYPENPRGIQAK